LVDVRVSLTTIVREWVGGAATIAPGLALIIGLAAVFLA
jgi:hypothetical protein